MNKDLIEQTLLLFPEVTWDRYSDEAADFSIFGWIEREDSYKDFVVINFIDGHPYETYSSSAKYSDEFCKRLDFNHSKCKRAEDIFNIPNVVRLKDKKHGK